MAENSKIEWTDHTFNPWIGCQKVGPGCDHCYAEVWDARGMHGGPTRWGPHAARTRTSATNWRKPIAWDKAAAKAGKRARVFCASLADVFDNHPSISEQWRHDLGMLILMTPHLDWLLLSKRIGNSAAMLEQIFPFGIPRNVWLGCTITSQAEANRDIPKLLATPAAVRFLSIEPLLGPVDLTAVQALGRAGWLCPLTGDHKLSPAHADHRGQRLDWIIVGGESGRQARPMHPDWPRAIRDQCAAAGVPFLFKQHGEWLPAEPTPDLRARATMPGQNFDVWAWPDGTRDGWRTGAMSIRVGKRAAGRLLDGVEHNGMPEVAHG